MDWRPRILSGMHPQVAEILSGAQRGEWGMGLWNLWAGSLFPHSFPTFSTSKNKDDSSGWIYKDDSKMIEGLFQDVFEEYVGMFLMNMWMWHYVTKRNRFTDGY